MIEKLLSPARMEKAESFYLLNYYYVYINEIIMQNVATTGRIVHNFDKKLQKNQSNQ